MNTQIIGRQARMQFLDFIRTNNRNMGMKNVMINNFMTDKISHFKVQSINPITNQLTKTLNDKDSVASTIDKRITQTPFFKNRQKNINPNIAAYLKLGSQIKIFEPLSLHDTGVQSHINHKTSVLNTNVTSPKNEVSQAVLNQEVLQGNIAKIKQIIARKRAKEYKIPTEAKPEAFKKKPPIVIAKKHVVLQPKITNPDGTIHLKVSPNKTNNSIALAEQIGRNDNPLFNTLNKLPLNEKASSSLIFTTNGSSFHKKPNGMVEQRFNADLLDLGIDFGNAKYTNLKNNLTNVNDARDTNMAYEAIRKRVLEDLARKGQELGRV